MAMDLKAFMVSQAANIEAQVYEKKYASIQYPALAPVVTEGNQWALSVERRTMDGAGKAADLGSLADDWPNVDVQYQRLTQEVHASGASYTIAEDEAAVANMGGFNISADKATTARRIVEERLDSIFRTGDSTRKWDAFARPPGATSTPAKGTGNAARWDNTGKTFTDFMGDVNDAISGVYNETKQIHLPNTLALPTLAFTALTARQVENTTMTWVEWARKNNAYTAATGNLLDIVAVHTLTTTGMVYEKDPDVLRFHLPMPATVHGPEIKNYGLTMSYGILARTGGLEWRIPKAARLITNIATP